MTIEEACELLRVSLSDTNGAIPCSSDMNNALRAVDVIIKTRSAEYISVEALRVIRLVKKCDAYKNPDKRREAQFDARQAAFRLVDVVTRPIG